MKWFTADEQNILFSVQSGYLPVTKTANDKDAILGSGAKIDPKMELTISAAVDTISGNEMYTTKAFASGTDARSILEYTLNDLATADREAVRQKVAHGQSLEEASALFCSEAYFEAWYEDVTAKLKAFEGK